MNILTDELPESIIIDEIEYAINWDFKTCILIIIAFEDPELSVYEKQAVMLQLLYDEIPEDVTKACEEAIKFLDLGDSGNKSVSDQEPPKRLYSFEKDSKLIYAAFRQTHGIDLTEENMHWWKFHSLFMDLGSETTFTSLVHLRNRLLTNKATKEEKQIANSMPDLINLPQIDTRTYEEKEEEERFLNLVKRRPQ